MHFLPALLLDTVTRVVGGRPILWRLHSNIWKSLTLLEHFAFSEFRFNNDRTLALADGMALADRERFNIDVRGMDWNAYFLILTQGVRRYLNKEPERTLKTALRKNQL